MSFHLVTIELIQCFLVESFRQNSGPVLLVFDVMGLLNVPLQSNIDLLLGGRHHIVLEKFEEFFLKLRLGYGAELVFFCDGRVQQVFQGLNIFYTVESILGCKDTPFKHTEMNKLLLVNANFVFLTVFQNKNDVWLERQSETYAKTIKIFDKIENSNGSLDVLNTLRNDEFPGLTTAIHALVNLCRKHGEFKLAMVAV